MGRCKYWCEKHPAWNFAGGACYGTKELDPCNCGGDEAKCDFYPHVREAAQENSMITPDEIKKALRHCAGEDDAFHCDDCPFCDQCASGMLTTVKYIEQLETKLNERNSLLAVLGVTVPDKEK